MSVIYPASLKCYICGQESEHKIVGSTSAQGAPDLDGRPSETARSTLTHWMQTCPSCGYCAPNISTKIPRLAAARILDVTRSEGYRRQLQDPSFPSIANAFLCFSHILEKISESLTEQVRPHLCAAWACDDAHNSAGAAHCRTLAATLLAQARQDGQQLSPQPGEDDALLVDLLRRSGQFEQALTVCAQALEMSANEVLTDVLRFQRDLISRRDSASHTMAEAP